MGSDLHGVRMVHWKPRRSTHNQANVWLTWDRQARTILLKSIDDRIT